MKNRAQKAFVILGLACFAAAIPAYSQAAGNRGAAAASSSSGGKADAYFNYSMAHLYAEQAAQFGGRGQYVNQAIEYFKKAMASNPTASVIGEELAEFYMRVGQMENAQQLANDLIKGNPDNPAAHKILARMYASQLDPDQGKVDANTLKAAIEHFQRAADLDPKDGESLSSLARLYRLPGPTKNDAAAEKAYKAVIALDGSDDEALTGLASLYAGRGDLTGAIALLEPVTGEDTDNWNAVQFLAELYEQSQNFDKAADTWKRLLPVANGTQVRHHYCDALLQTNRVDEAIAAWQDLAAAEPKVADNLIQLSELWAKKRNFAKAHEVLNQAKRVENSVSVRMAEAELMDAEGKTPEGIAAVEALLKETKSTVYSDAERLERINMLRSLGNMQKNADKVQDAVATFRQIAELNPKAAAAVEVQVVEIMVEGKDFKGARIAGDAALKKFPADPVVALAHASLLSTLGEYDKALAELNALPDARQDRQVLINIAQVLEKAKRYKQALETLDAAEKLAGSARDKQALVFMRGAMYEQEKDFDNAEKQFRSVLSADPENAGALNYLGYMLADRNVRLDEAQQLISKAVDLDPDNGAYLDSLGWVHYRQNRLDQAAMELRQALDRIKKDPTVHDHLAEVFFKQGKYKEASQEWELSVAEMNVAAPSDKDPAELKRIMQRLEEARAKVTSAKLK